MTCMISLSAAAEIIQLLPYCLLEAHELLVIDFRILLCHYKHRTPPGVQGIDSSVNK